MFRVDNGLPTAILTSPDCFHLVSTKPRTKTVVHHFFGNDVSLASLEHGSGDSCPHKDEFLWRQDVYWLPSKHVRLAWTCHSPHRWAPSSYSCVIWSSFIIDSVTQAFFLQGRVKNPHAEPSIVNSFRNLLGKNVILITASQLWLNDFCHSLHWISSIIWLQQIYMDVSYLIQLYCFNHYPHTATVYMFLFTLWYKVGCERCMYFHNWSYSSGNFYFTLYHYGLGDHCLATTLFTLFLSGCGNHIAHSYCSGDGFAVLL